MSKPLKGRIFIPGFLGTRPKPGEIVLPPPPVKLPRRRRRKPKSR
jgi:hypothetical protein